MPRVSERAAALEELEVLAYSELADLARLSSSEDEWTSDNPPDAFGWSGSDNDDERGRRLDLVLHATDALEKHRYWSERRDIPKTSALAELILVQYHQGYPDHFRTHLRVNPSTFDLLVDKLTNHPVWYNRSATAEQLPVRFQVAVGLYKLGHSGNASGHKAIAAAWGIGTGTVTKIAKRFITAVLDTLHSAYVFWPEEGSAERNRARDEAQIYANGPELFRHGWCMMDGTLIPIITRPHYYGDNFYDRKKNYSLSCQVVNLPSGRIIDYTVGHVGSASDKTTCKATKLWTDQMEDGPKQMLEPEDWCWGDGGYAILPWLVIPYNSIEINAKPTRSRFNVALSRVRIRCEHTIGYLKGQFQCLKGLQMQINNQRDVERCANVIRACITLYNFTLQHEKTNISADEDDFGRQGRAHERGEYGRAATRALTRLANASAATAHAETAKGHRREASLDRETGRLRRAAIEREYWEFKEAQLTQEVAD